MDTIIIVVVIGAVIGMAVMMIRYAGFIHSYHGQKDQKPSENGSSPEPPAKDDERRRK